MHDARDVVNTDGHGPISLASGLGLLESEVAHVANSKISIANSLYPVLPQISEDEAARRTHIQARKDFRRNTAPMVRSTLPRDELDGLQRVLSPRAACLQEVLLAPSPDIDSARAEALCAQLAVSKAFTRIDDMKPLIRECQRLVAAIVHNRLHFGISSSFENLGILLEELTYDYTLPKTMRTMACSFQDAYDSHWQRLFPPRPTPGSAKEVYEQFQGAHVALRQHYATMGLGPEGE